MNKKNQVILLFVLALLFYPLTTSARPEYAAKESRNCPYCHTRDGPPQLNEVGGYYGTHNHSFEGYIPSPRTTPAPAPTQEIEIGVHMNTWDVGMRAMSVILFMLVLVYVMRL